MTENRSIFLEYGYTSLNHVGEELCGDKVECSVNGRYTTLVLADGLGSGVKANILSTLTSKILCTMVSNDISIEDCLETVLQSLPVCKVRGVAYSTFSVLHVDNVTGKGYLFEFDNPQAIYMKNGKCGDLSREEKIIFGKIVYKSDVFLEKDDVLFLMSDGVIHAGVGSTLNFGWERDDVMKYLDETYDKNMSARAAACLLASACNDLYLNEPGDDTTVLAIKARNQLKVNILVGPPADKSTDEYYISQFLDGADKKVVCGGTSSTIVARYLKTEVKVCLEFPDKEVPPMGFIDGIDLTTEGVLTLRRLLSLSEKYIAPSDLTPKTFTKTDGASRLAEVCFEQASHLKFFIGQSVNAAHQGLPIDITMKLKLVESIAKNLRAMGKEVELIYD